MSPYISSIFNDFLFSFFLNFKYEALEDLIEDDVPETVVTAVDPFRCVVLFNEDITTEMQYIKPMTNIVFLVKYFVTIPTYSVAFVVVDDAFSVWNLFRCMMKRT